MAGLFLDNADGHLCGGGNLYSRREPPTPLEPLDSAESYNAHGDKHSQTSAAAAAAAGGGGTKEYTNPSTNASQLWSPTIAAYRDACTLLETKGKGCILSIANAITAVSAAGTCVPLLPARHLYHQHYRCWMQPRRYRSPWI